MYRSKSAVHVSDFELRLHKRLHRRERHRLGYYNLVVTLAFLSLFCDSLCSIVSAPVGTVQSKRTFGCDGVVQYRPRKTQKACLFLRVFPHSVYACFRVVYRLPSVMKRVNGHGHGDVSMQAYEVCVVNSVA